MYQATIELTVTGAWVGVTTGAGVTGAGVGATTGAGVGGTTGAGVTGTGVGGETGASVGGTCVGVGGLGEGSCGGVTGIDMLRLCCKSLPQKVSSSTRPSKSMALPNS